MGGGRLSLMVLLVAIMVSSRSAAAEQTLHIVGDDEGWGLKADYAKWASAKSFAVGDALVFSFVTGAHDVAEVTKSDYEGCTYERPISHFTEGSFVNITLESPGTHYFICTFPGHCSRGQKVAVNAGGGSLPPSASIGTGAAAAAATPSTSPTHSNDAAPTPATSPTHSNDAAAPPSLPPSQSSASSLVAAAFSAGLFSAAVVFSF